MLSDSGKRIFESLLHIKVAGRTSSPLNLEIPLSRATDAGGDYFGPMLPANRGDIDPHMGQDQTLIRKLKSADISRLRSQSTLLSLADIVRELVHNSIDAAAETLIVHIDLTALTIVVVDDGEGISQDNFARISQQYHTSRDQSFTYLGYKGEALNLINACLDLHIESKVPANALHSWGSRPDIAISRPSFLAKRGTIAVVTNAFGKLPVRQLQAVQTSKSKHIEAIRRVVFNALCMRPNIGLKIRIHDASLSIQVPRGVAMSNERHCFLMRSIFGSTLLPKYETIRYLNGVWQLAGIVGLAPVVSPKHQFLVVNGHSHSFSASQESEIARLFSRHHFGNKYNRNPVFIVSISSKCSMDRFLRFDTQKEWSIVWKMLVACFEGYLSAEGYTPAKSRNQLRGTSPRKLADLISVEEWDTQVLKLDFDSMRIIGQFDRKFILVLVDAHGKRIMCMVDQHACDERIKVEALYRTFVEQIMDPHLNIRLRLEFPITFTLIPDEALLFSQYHAGMVMHGIDYFVQDNTVFLTHLPFVLIGASRKMEASVMGSRLLSHIYDIHTHRKSASWNSSLADWYQAVPHLPRMILDAFNSQACRSALKFGSQILHMQMCELVNSWRTCRAPYACAHGRPCLIPIKDF